MFEDWFVSGWKILRRTKTKDSGGAFVETWATWLEIKAVIEKIDANRVPRADVDGVVATHIVYMNSHDVTNDDRLEDPYGKVYEITHINDVHALGEHLEIEVFRTELEAQDDA